MAHGWKYPAGTRPTASANNTSGIIPYREGGKSVDDFPDNIPFTINDVVGWWHDSGSAGTHWYISLEKTEGQWVYEINGIQLHAHNIINMFKREMQRVRDGLLPTVFVATKKSKYHWVNPSACNPAIDTSQFESYNGSVKKESMVG